MEFNTVIGKRHSAKKLKTTKKPSYKDIIKAIEVATMAPLAGNLSSLRYILVSDKEKINQLAEAAQQEIVAEASYVVVVCSDKKLLEKYYYERSDMYSRQQAGAAIENFLLKLTDLSLDSCWVGAFADKQVKKILKIPDNIDVEVLLPVGYEMGKSAKKQKIDLNNIIYFDTYKNRTMKPYKKPRN